MFRRFALILVMMVGFAAPLGVAAQRSTPAADAAVCGDIEEYFWELDHLMFAGMSEYLADEEWMRDMERMSKKANATESGLFTLTEDEIQPFLDLMSVPGDVMLDFPEEDIPAEVAEFHESSMGYWLIMPAMMRSVVVDGIFSAMVFVEDLESISETSFFAHEDLTDLCPSMIEKLEQSADDFGFDSLTDPSDLAGLDAPEGFAYSLMILPAEEYDPSAS